MYIFPTNSLSENFGFTKILQSHEARKAGSDVDTIFHGENEKVAREFMQEKVTWAPLGISSISLLWATDFGG